MEKIFMKHSLIKKIISFCAVSSAVFAILLSCEIGLGPAVDVTAPEVTLTSHKDNDCVGSSFVLRGIATDNDAVTKLTIDFDDADIHFQITSGGSWQKKTSTTGWTTVSNSSEHPYYCSFGDTWNWAVYVDTSEKKDTFSDFTYTFAIEAFDEMGNSGKNSKVEYALNVDENLPVVEITKPEVDSSYDVALANCKSYKLQNANSLPYLVNGDFTISGRQSEALAFRELLIEFDDGKVASNTVTNAGDASTTVENLSKENPFDRQNVYYSKTLRTGENGITDLRTWSFTVKESDWISDEKNAELKTSDIAKGNHIIRVVSTSVTSANAYERKVLGWFVWCPEADTPWISTQIGKENLNDVQSTQIYPSSSLTGQANDDDGILSLTYTLEKQKDDNFSVYNGLENKKLSLSEDKAKSSQWAITSPSENGIYKLTMSIKDLNGKTGSLIRYFKVLDVSPPKINITSPAKDSAVLESSDAKNITFTGTVTDDGKIKENSLYLVFLNPDVEKSKEVENKVRYRVSDDGLDKATESGFVDENGNRLYKINLGNPSFSETEKIYTYTFKKTFNLFNDLKIGSGTSLSSLDFILRAVDDSNQSTIDSVTLSGDTESPVLTFDSIKLLDASGKKIYPSSADSFVFAANDNPPTFPKIENGYKAVLAGTWSDNSTTKWNDASKIGKIKLVWNASEIGEITPASGGKWTYEVTAIPKASGVMELSIQDFGGNKKSVTQSVFIDSSNASLERISSDSDDGAYGAGSEISISLEFTKNTTVEGNPVLKLNNGKTAVYEEGSNGKAKHVFKYTVAKNDDMEKLLVTEISGATSWKDASNGTPFTVTLPTEANKTLASRNISIDTKAPAIKSVSVISPSAGAYKADTDILLKLEFSEDVSITNNSGSLNDNFKLNFSHQKDNKNVTTTAASFTGSNMILFTYRIADGENSSKLAFSGTGENVGITHSQNIEIKDMAGNVLTSWVLPSAALDKNIIIDTTLPSSPGIDAAWGNSEVVLSQSGTSFKITGIENGATVEYTLDGSNYQTYKGKVTNGVSDAIQITNNGNYSVKARQTDSAGNGPVESNAVSVFVDKGELLTEIKSSTPNGQYKIGTEITGILNFRKSVTLQKDSGVTLNVKRNNEYLTVPINECMSGAQTFASFTFTYTVNEGDEIESTGNSQKYLNVKAFSFDSVKLNGNETALDFDSDVVKANKNLADKSQIQIKSSYPKVTNATLSSDNKTLTLSFDSSVTKISTAKDADDNPLLITLEMTEDFHAPAVLSVSEYNDLIAAGLAIENYYTEGVNGAALDNNGKPKNANDTTTKYILNYDIEDTQSALVKIFTDKNKNKVSIPIYASNIKQGTSTTLTVTLTGEYVIPVKGAVYKLTVPAGTVQDSVRNISQSEYSETFTASGIEDPVIRIKKSSYVINGLGTSGDFTTTATVEMPQTAEFKINCKTPGVFFKYNTNIVPTAGKLENVQVNGKKYTTKSGDISYNTPNNDYDYTTGSILLADNYKVDSYAAASGLKIAISAQALKNGSPNPSKTVYEYASRTVLKFKIESAYNHNAGGGSLPEANTEARTKLTEKGSADLTFKDLRVWVAGGDAPSGSNSTVGFPLSWGDTSGFKLMAGAHSTTKQENANEMYGEWWWVSWDITAPTYHGFFIGTVPYDAATKGPNIWFAAECGWVPKKENYILYPGETLTMLVTNGLTPDFHFRPKNIAYRD